MQCALVGFFIKWIDYLNRREKIRNQLKKTIPNWQSNRTSRVLQENQNYCRHIWVCSDLQALVFKCIAGCHLVALGHGMLTED